MNLFKDPRTNWKYILIVIVLAIIIGGFTIWQYQKMQKEETALPEIRVPEKEERGAKDCINDDDCIVFGKTGDCNCGCFDKDYKWKPEGECFCVAPTSCQCVDGECEEVFERTTEEQACIDSGGTVAASMCCKSTEDFPNLCLIGPCGCSPDNSHQIKICDCGADKCFNGNECVIFEPGDETAKCEFNEMIFYFRSGCGWCQKVKDDGTISKIEELGVKVTQIDVKIGPVEHEFSGVPTFVINEKVYVGYRTFEELNELLGCL